MNTSVKTNQKVVDALKVILSEMNGGDKKEIAASISEVIRCEHRTIQQNFWGVMLKVQMAYAENPFDLRNEASVELAKLVKKVAAENNMDMGLPYI